MRSTHPLFASTVTVLDMVGRLTLQRWASSLVVSVPCCSTLSTRKCGIGTGWSMARNSAEKLCMSIGSVSSMRRAVVLASRVVNPSPPND